MKREVKLKKGTDGVYRSVPGSSHEAFSIEIIESKSQTFCGYYTIQKRFDLIFVWRQNKRFALKNNRGDGSWSLGSARYYAYYYLEKSFDSNWRLSFFKEDV